MKINNCLLCLDLSSMDFDLVRQSIAFLEKVNPGAKATLYHNIRFDFIDNIGQWSSEDMARLKRNIRSEIQSRFGQLFEASSLSHEVLITDDTTTTSAIIHTIKQSKADFVIMGKKRDDEGAGIIPQRLLATDPAETPVLLIPSDWAFVLDRIVVAVDLGPKSTFLLRQTSEIAQHLKCPFTGIYVNKIPVAYFPYIKKTDDDLKENLRKQAEVKFRKFLKEFPMDNADKFTLEIKGGYSVKEEVIDYCKEHHADLLILSRIGKPNLLGTKMGGVAKRILNSNVNFPLLVF